MAPQRLLGTCSIHQCSKNSSNFRRLTQAAYNKAKVNGSLTLYPYLQLHDVICFPHYTFIVKENKVYHQNHENNEFQNIEG